MSILIPASVPEPNGTWTADSLADVPPTWLITPPAPIRPVPPATEVLPAREPGTALPAVPAVEPAPASTAAGFIASLATPTPLAEPVAPATPAATTVPVFGAGEHLEHLVKPVALTDPALVDRLNAVADQVPAKRKTPWGLIALFGPAIAVTLAVASAGFSLSAKAQADMAEGVGLVDLGWLMPVSVDGTIIVATLAWQIAAIRGLPFLSRLYPVIIVVLGTLISMAINAAHASAFVTAAGGHVDERVAVGVAAMPSLFLALTVHLIAMLVEIIRTPHGGHPAPKKVPTLDVPVVVVEAVASGREVRAYRYRRPDAPVGEQPAERAPGTDHAPSERPTEQPAEHVTPGERAGGEHETERPSERPASTDRAAGEQQTERAGEQHSERKPSPSPSTTVPGAGGSGGASPEARRWILRQIKGGTMPTGAQVGQRFTVHETTGRRWIREIKSELEPA